MLSPTNELSSNVNNKFPSEKKFFDLTLRFERAELSKIVTYAHDI